MTETAMCWGFECGDGWYHLIDTLCNLLSSEYLSAKKSYEFVKECLEERGGKYPWSSKEEVTAEEVELKRQAMEEAAKYVPTVSQVKEKFGGLRFYVDGVTDKQWNYIHFAESMSYRICEICGAPGKRYTDGWHTVLCDDHAKEQNRKEVEKYDE